MPHDRFDPAATLTWLDAVQAFCDARGIDVGHLRSELSHALLAPIRAEVADPRTVFLNGGGDTRCPTIDDVWFFPAEGLQADTVDVSIEGAGGDRWRGSLRFAVPESHREAVALIADGAPWLGQLVQWLGYGPRGPGPDEGARVAAFAREGVDLTPNHFLKRPGPHRAYAVDPEGVSGLREALGAARQWGVLGPLAKRLGIAEDQLGGWQISPAWRLATVGEDFGLQRFGMLLQAGDTWLGEPLLPDSEVTSLWWRSHGPWLPQRVVPAAELLRLDFSAAPFRDMLLACFDGCEVEVRPAWERWPEAIDALWGASIRAALDRYRAGLEAVAAAGGHVLVWEEAEGMIL